MTAARHLFRHFAWVKGATSGARSLRGERLVHAIWASLLALVMAAAMLLEPVEWILWTNQSRLRQVTPSGDIVYLQIDGNVSSPDYPAERAKLAEALDRLRAAGAKRVFIDTVLESSISPQADARLITALRPWGERLAFVDRIDESLNDAGKEERTSGLLASGHRRVVQGVSADWPNTIWSMPRTYRTATGRVPSFASALAGVPDGRDGSFLIDYGLPSRSISRLEFSDLLHQSEALGQRVRDKSVVVGVARTALSSDYRVPSQLNSPPSFVAINAAETLKRGPIFYINGMLLVLGMAAFLIASAAVPATRRRRAAYAAVVALPPYLFLVSAAAGLRMELSYCIPMLAIFGVLRWRSNWKLRVAQLDPDTGLPTFRALIRDLAARPLSGRHVVVAKIHNYESILRTLTAAERAVYVRKLVERLRVSDSNLQVFLDGHHLAWLVEQDDETRLMSHLEGLRAIFAGPVTVDTRNIDVGITFGAARLDAAQADRSLAAALAAVEETSEALEPIKLASDAAENDTLWDLSLRARIDAAMEAGEVFCVYQPKIDISVDRLIGVEALVRWEDPERGFIPPLHFVMQCEKAGRMEYLTRYVLQSACSAAKLLHFRGSRITMSVNISATLLTDMRIVGIVRNVLQATGFDANYLVLEITETSRIHDLTQARSVLKALKALGTHLSMDDFGVGAANFEALQALPFDEIKIDRQFVSLAASNNKARAITASIVGLGTSARIAVVAEGAETDLDIQMLRDIGCWQVQGYALARPMPLSKLLTFIGGDSETGQALMV